MPSSHVLILSSTCIPDVLSDKASICSAAFTASKVPKVTLSANHSASELPLLSLILSALAIPAFFIVSKYKILFCSRVLFASAGKSASPIPLPLDVTNQSLSSLVLLFHQSVLDHSSVVISLSSTYPSTHNANISLSVFNHGLPNVAFSKLSTNPKNGLMPCVITFSSSSLTFPK